MSTKNYTFRKLFLKNEREIKIFPAKKNTQKMCWQQICLSRTTKRSFPSKEEVTPKGNLNPGMKY